MDHASRPVSGRRDFLLRAGAGFGGLALAGLMSEAARAEAPRARPIIDPSRPLAIRPPHFAPKAKRVIFLFMYGSPSQVDTFDYKPDLLRLDGKPVPESFKKADKVGGVFNACKDELMAGPWKWKRHGQSGLWVSDLLPRTAELADDLCVIKSMVSESSNHAPAAYQMNTGVTIAGKPSMGSWVTYGLGSENENLPGYVLLYKVAGLGGSANWGNGFLPAAFQGTPFRHEGPPVLDLQPPPDVADTQRSTLDLIQALNRRHRDGRPGGPLDLDGRIASYELAYKMQSEALDVGNLGDESSETLALYGLDSDNKDTALFGRMCLISRRLAEKGVRFVQLYNAVDKFGWDGHDDNTGNHKNNAKQTDRPIAGLLTDLKRRGLLDETLVIWTGEFGRTPMVQGNRGRNHNPYGFTVWMAGGGVKGGQSIGETDAIGLRAEQSPYAVKDLHATILTALGLHPEELSFEHNGRPERLTGVAGSARVIPSVLV